MSSENIYTRPSLAVLSASQNPNRNSFSSLHSDAPTFHTAINDIELPVAQISNPISNDIPSESSDPIITSPSQPPHPISQAMNRSDSGYATFMDPPALPNDKQIQDSTDARSEARGRRSTSASSTSTARRQSTRDPITTSSTPRNSISSTSHRPVPRRASKSGPATTSGRTSSRRSSLQYHRPGMQSRYATTGASISGEQRVQTHQFFQFPSLVLSEASSSSSPEAHEMEDSDARDNPPPPPPPTRPIYWTSPQTRRLEYAAIDACSNGIRGVLVRMVPDCVLPREFRSTWRSRFHGEGGGSDDDDSRSVRRYRICVGDGNEEEKKNLKQPKTGTWRRLFGMGRS